MRCARDAFSKQPFRSNSSDRRAEFLDRKGCTARQDCIVHLVLAHYGCSIIRLSKLTTLANSINCVNSGSIPNCLI